MLFQILKLKFRQHLATRSLRKLQMENGASDANSRVPELPKQVWEVTRSLPKGYPIFDILNFIMMIFRFCCCYDFSILLLYMANTWEILQNGASIRVWNIGMPVSPSKKLLENRKYSVQSSKNNNNNFPTPKKSVYFSFQTISHFYHFYKYEK